MFDHSYLPLGPSQDIVWNIRPAVVCFGVLCIGGFGRTVHSVHSSYSASFHDNLSSWRRGKCAPCLDMGWDVPQFLSTSNPGIYHQVMHPSVQPSVVFHWTPSIVWIAMIYCRVMSSYCILWCWVTSVQRHQRKTLTTHNHCKQSVCGCCLVASHGTQ